jgi:glycosyltransferase involved in cell wall biosynthesis
VKLVIQIPCLNEERTLPRTLADLPRSIPGVSKIMTLVIDDGSTDRTIDIAREHGATRVVSLCQRRGLANAFYRGLYEALAMGADIIVNTDGDNQYRGADIAELIRPVVNGEADMVVGSRAIEENPEFSAVKKRLQRLGSWVVRQLSGTKVPDATSGFRAYSREAALRITVLSNFTYTLETLIQANKKNLSVSYVPIGTNPKTRESRLFTTISSYVRRSLATMFRVYVLYQPLRFFSIISGVLIGGGLLLILRFLYLYLTTEGPTGHIQSLVLGGVLVVIGVLVAAMAVLSDLTAVNRRLLEELLYNQRKRYLGEDTKTIGPHP